jgi:hypothetical protein
MERTVRVPILNRPAAYSGFVVPLILSWPGIPAEPSEAGDDQLLLASTHSILLGRTTAPSLANASLAMSTSRFPPANDIPGR